MRVSAIPQRVPARYRVALLGAFLAAAALMLPLPAASAAPSPVAPAVTSATTSLAQAPLSAAAADFSSIFAENDPTLDGAGWALCGSPITWDVDLGTLDQAAGERAVADLQWAFAQWAQVSNLSFAYSGATTLSYDDATFSLTRADGQATADRHIDIAFLADAVTARMGGQTVGLGSPSKVVPTTKEIVGGTAVFRADHAQSADQSQTRSLYLHELGHVLGLAHAHDASNVMYPVVGDKVALGPGDVNGVHALDNKTCTTTA